MNKLDIEKSVQSVVEKYFFDPDDQATLDKIKLELNEHLNFDETGWIIKRIGSNQIALNTKLDGKDIGLTLTFKSDL